VLKEETNTSRAEFSSFDRHFGSEPVLLFNGLLDVDGRFSGFRRWFSNGAMD
jgi:hypothetical protein